MCCRCWAGLGWAGQVRRKAGRRAGRQVLWCRRSCALLRRAPTRGHGPPRLPCSKLAAEGRGAPDVAEAQVHCVCVCVGGGGAGGGLQCSACLLLRWRCGRGPAACPERCAVQEGEGLRTCVAVHTLRAYPARRRLPTDACRSHPPRCVVQAARRAKSSCRRHDHLGSPAFLESLEGNPDLLLPHLKQLSLSSSAL